jgi:VanZ family protein
LKYLSLLPAIIIMIIIFSFSSKPADDSNQSSMSIVTEFLKIYENVSNVQYQAETKEKIENTLNHIVRKSAHFCEYALLAAALAFHLYIRKQKGKLLYLLPVVVVFLYASIDELHQLFVPGRSGAFRDVLLDTTGGVAGSLIFALIVINIIGKIKKGRTSSVI